MSDETEFTVDTPTGDGPVMVQARCGHCHQWMKNVSAELNMGTCVAVPPIPVAVMKAGHVMFVNRRPQMQAEEGCGQFLPRIAPA